MEDTDIIKARNISLKVLEKNQSNRSTKNRSDRVHWEEIKSKNASIIRSGVIVNIIHDDIESFIDVAYFLLNIRMKNALKKCNGFKICTVLCSKSGNENIKIADKYIDDTTDIESWYNNSVKRPNVSKLKKLKVICLVVCFSESESESPKNNIYASTSVSSNILNVQKKRSPITEKTPVRTTVQNIVTNISSSQINNVKSNKVENNTCGKTDKIKFFHQNMQSIGNKIEKLESLARERNIDFLLLSEHWITENNDIPDIDGYYWISAYKRKSRLRGGAAVLVSAQKSGKITKRNDINSMSKEMIIELAACSWNERNLIILALYRPPNGSIPQFLEILKQVLAKVIINEKSDIIIGGDFNIDFLLTEDSATKRLINMLRNYNLHITIQEYTRERLRTKKCIDNIITSLENFKSHVVDADISDHYGQEMLVECKEPNNRMLRGRIMLDARA